jgi:hypothetical protein
MNKHSILAMRDYQHIIFNIATMHQDFRSTSTTLNREHHSEFAAALSSPSQVKSRPCLKLHHVYLGPTYPRSAKAL